MTGGALSVARATAAGEYDSTPAVANADADAIALGEGSLAASIAIAQADVEEGWTAGVADANALAVAVSGGTALSLSQSNALNTNPDELDTQTFDLIVDFGAGGVAWAWGYADSAFNVALGGAGSIALAGTTAEASSIVTADGDPTDPDGLPVNVNAVVTPPPS
ncbi:hypothetical protein ES703_78834 [subsurface metagenome]